MMYNLIEVYSMRCFGQETQICIEVRNEMRKKILALILMTALCLVCGPAEVFAAGSDSSETAVSVEAPSQLKAYSGYKRVTLEWPKAEGASKYVIYRAEKGGKLKKIKTVSGSTVKYVNKVKVDKKYTYKIYSLDADGNRSTTYAKCKGEAFRQIHYKISFRARRTLTSTNKGQKKKTFKRDYRTTAIDFRNGKYVFNAKCSDGTTRQFHIPRIAAYKQKVSQINTDTNYSPREARDFVNQVGLGSGTQYLIFVNTYTQHEYVFKGKKGKWKLQWHDDIATGRASTPTQTGKTHISAKSPVENGLKYWSMCKVFSIHGLPGGAKVNYPTSGACVRNYNDRAEWVYYNCKKGTTVYVY